MSRTDWIICKCIYMVALAFMAAAAISIIAGGL